MITYGGERVTLEAGAPSLHTIGVSLGGIFRFCRHTKRPYSVLAHSLVVAELMPPSQGIYGVLHDGQECIFSDVPTPMKTEWTRRREYKVLERIYIANGLPWPIPDKAQEAVDEADELALIAEAHIQEHPGSEAQWGTEVDELAAKLTKKYANPKKVIEFLDLEGTGVAGDLFVKKVKHYMSLAGMDAIEAW